MPSLWFNPNVPPTYENPNLNDIIEVIYDSYFLLIIDKNKVNYYRRVYDPSRGYDSLELIYSINIEENINSVYSGESSIGKIILATDNSLITILWSWDNVENTFSTEPYIDKTIPISNPKICRSHYRPLYYGPLSNLCVLYSGQTVYY